MKIAITGGSGFIGTNLSSLLKSQHDILILDRIPSKIQDVDFTECDLLDSKKLSDVLEGFDIVIHLAAAVGVKLTEEEPLHTLNLNIQGTQNILESCKKNHVKKIIFASSSEIYGEAIHIPIKETDTPMPITNYGVSKITGEEYVKAYSKAHSIKYSILRFFNAYGPGQSNSFVMSEFVFKAIANKTITIHGNGEQLRAFCHISDIVNGISLCLDKGDNEIFNIGNNTEPVTIFELAKTIKKITNSKSEITFLPFEDTERKRTSEIMKRIPDITKAQNILGYNPRISLNEGIKTIFQ
ncbi:MAG: NAD-dependent dehydratase [Chloroflexi bacterium]|nr:NAD-dependent dehydratase [Chloroflexota bacterium]